VAERFCESVRDDPPDFVILNFANPDMVAHTGILSATIQALETVDECLGRVLEALKEIGAKVVVTSDHGNAESLLEPDGTVGTAHSINPVPLVLLEEGVDLREGAGLSDVAPTILEFMGLDVPAEMTGRSLLRT
jgi:2,3-bisphosphoglycerate-independent phosphoglycerate mutase